MRTLQQHFPSPKHRLELGKQKNVIYKIPCTDCTRSYIGETGRAYETRKNKHVKNVKNYTDGSNIASHAWKNGHKIGFKRNFRTRKTLESWHTETTNNADNNSKPLPKQYTLLTKKRCLR